MVMDNVKKTMHLFHSLATSYKTLSKILLHREYKAIIYNEIVSALLADKVEQEMSFSRSFTSSIALAVTQGQSHPTAR